MTFLHELTALPVSVREGMVKALPEKSLAWFAYCTNMRPSGQRDASLRLSMTRWWCLLFPTGVTLSRSEGLVIIAHGRDLVEHSKLIRGLG